MAFREKSAWVSLLATLVVYGVYFSIFLRGLAAGRSVLLGAVFVEAVVILSVAQIVLHVLIAVTSPRGEARAPSDERERLIQARASAIAFYTLQAGAVLAAISVYFFDKAAVANFVIAAVALAQTTQYAAIIVGYRRGV